MTRQEFRDEGWHSVEAGELPPLHQTVEFAREACVHVQAPWFGEWSQLPAEFNAAGLWWRTP
jgi:hypothetical protein